MAETESAHGKLSTVDQKYTAPRFIAMLAGTLLVALAVIYTIASFHGGQVDFTWSPFAHDIVRHTIETGAI